MAEVKLTKNELRAQQKKLKQLQKYLPTLQLKKAMLQAEVNDARLEIERLENNFKKSYHEIEEHSSLLSERTGIDPVELSKVTHIQKRWENIAGVEVPYLDGVSFSELDYSLVDTPPWMDTIIAGLRALAKSRTEINVTLEKKEALEKELREVSIRVNLFEKILIPGATKNIKKIRVFLGDQQLSAVSQAKVAKSKIEAKKSAKSLQEGGER